MTLADVAIVVTLLSAGILVAAALWCLWRVIRRAWCECLDGAATGID